MSLAEIQHRFVAALRDPQANLDALIAQGSGRGLEVYRHAHGASLRACLAETFEKTHAWIGDDAFEAAARAHIAAHPPRGWSLNDYGEGFAAELDRLHPDDPEIGEIAWLDWALRRAFDGPDSPEPDPTTLANLDWDCAVLTFAPTLAWRPVISNAAAIWTALAEVTPPPAAQRLDATADLLVWRRGFSPLYRTVSGPEQSALRCALGGGDFTAVCESLAQAMPDDDPVEAAGALLAQWLGEGLVVGAAVVRT